MEVFIHLTPHITLKFEEAHFTLYIFSKKNEPTFLGLFKGIF
jgi:hypothetical protein